MEKTEYITREEAKMSHCNACSWYGTCTDETMCEDVKAILAIPASDVRPVVYGEWRKVYMSSPSSFVGTCSVCGQSNDIPPPILANFCPSCGADMRKEKKYGDCY